MSESSDSQIRGEDVDTTLRSIYSSCFPALHRQYVNPEETRAAIRRAILDTIHDSPRVLIDTVSGQLCDKSEQAASFESLPIFNNLISSMTTRIDDVRIKQDVTKYYRYGMFSHNWEDNEPLFDQVVRNVVYDLEQSLTHDKLKMFCKMVWDAGLHWAWSDTCCINKADDCALQEAILTRFKWYEGSALTIVFLCDILSPSRRGDLTKSIWNSRARAWQEYCASKVIRFYTRDWKLYMNFDIPNHKDSPEIISEMEEATGVWVQALISLRPGLDDIRVKLWLASTRQTTLVEDVACSLFGIFPTSLPVVYGEGEVLGRLLAQLLTSSGDASILSWTGESGSFNSCLPSNITVFNQLPPPHIPLAMPRSKMEKTIAGLGASSLLATNLYDRLGKLPVVSFSGQRMKLPCLIFGLGPVTGTWNAGGRVFRAPTDVLGIVEIRTEEDLSQLNPLYLVHPWMDFLLDRQPVGSVIATLPEENADEPPLAPIVPEAPEFASRPELPFGRQTATHPKDPLFLYPPSLLSSEDKWSRALQVIARLKLPFGALLLTRHRGEIYAYRRVAVETLITVQVQEITPAVLKKLVSSVQVLDVL